MIPVLLVAGLFASTAFCQIAMPPAAGPVEARAEFQGAATLEELRDRLSAIVDQRRYSAAQWGIKIIEVQGGETIFEHNPGQLFSPASNSKLYTVALGLDRFGVDHRTKTSLYSAAEPDAEGVLQGDLVVYGRGDPTFNRRIHQNDPFYGLQRLASALTNAGVRRISGNLVGDTSFIRGHPFGSGWTWDDQFYYYGAEISSLTVNDNLVVCSVLPGTAPGEPCTFRFEPPTRLFKVHNRARTVAADRPRDIRLTRLPSRNELYLTGELPVGGTPFRDDVTVHEPAGLFLELFAQALARSGVTVLGTNRVADWLDEPAPVDGLVKVGAVESLPMRDIAREIQKPSQNLYTDLLLAQVGERTRTSQTPPFETSEDLGIRELSRFLAQAGVPRGHVLFEEGSGLSRNNLTTPAATVALLRYMANHKAAEPWMDALPIAGVDGTLRNRMKGTPAAGKVRAKTGTLRWANSLSGYVTTAAGEQLAFCLMLNRYFNADGTRTGRAELDAIAAELAGFQGKVR